jgi:glutathione synthase/RimK-type ligase-like ATP-grasp enzyme
MSNLVKKMKNIAKKVSSAVYPLIDLDKRSTGFELFGMDFIVDSNFTPWLLEVNVNPCL